MAKRLPTYQWVSDLAFSSHDLARHIERHWSIDGEPLRPAELGPHLMNADGARRAADLLQRVDEQQAGLYPGPVFEYQLLALVDEWDRLRADDWVPHATPWFKNAPDCDVLTPREWPGWESDIQQVGHELIAAVNDILKPVRHEVMPEWFSGDAVAAVKELSMQLLALVDFVPTELHREILDKLDGVAMTADDLEAAVCVSRSTLYGGKAGKGGLKDLVERGLVLNERKVGGYYRPDAPPEESN